MNGDNGIRDERPPTDPFEYHDGVLDVDAFPRFAPLLIATKDHAVRNGCRFDNKFLQVSGKTTIIHSMHSETLLESLVAQTVQAFGDRLREGDVSLHEELERASRIVMAESVRSAVIATCKEHGLWPPAHACGVDSLDCSYEDMSAPLDVIAQRAFNDEARRLRGDTGKLVNRATTASYIVDFAENAGTLLPPVPDTFQMMLCDVRERASEWESCLQFRGRGEMGIEDEKDVVAEHGVEELHFDSKAFPRFARFLADTEEYAAMNDYRFRANCYSSLLRCEDLGMSSPIGCSAAGASAPIVPGKSDLHGGCDSEHVRVAVLQATPTLREYATRLRGGESGLLEELERASRAVKMESVRSAVLATCHALDLWPPAPPPLGIDATDCTYEDMSAPLNIIAQRAYNDEARRRRGEAGVAGKLARRARTALYLVDFAEEIGAPLPFAQETFDMMLAELELRTEEWELQLRESKRQVDNDSSLSDSFSLRNALNKLRHFTGELTATEASPPSDDPVLDYSMHGFM